MALLVESILVLSTIVQLGILYQRDPCGSHGQCYFMRYTINGASKVPFWFLTLGSYCDAFGGQLRWLSFAVDR